MEKDKEIDAKRTTRCFECGKENPKTKCKRCYTLFCSRKCMDESWRVDGPHRAFCEENGRTISEFLTEVSKAKSEASSENHHVGGKDDPPERKRPHGEKEKGAKLPEEPEAKRRKSEKPDTSDQAVREAELWTIALSDIGVARFLETSDSVSTVVAMLGTGLAYVAKDLARRIVAKSPDAFSRMCRVGCLECAKLLVDDGTVTPKIVRHRGCEPIAEALRGGHLDVARFLIERFPLSLIDARFHQLFAAACYGGNVDAMRYLLCGYDIGPSEMADSAGTDDFLMIIGDLFRGDHADAFVFFVEFMGYKPPEILHTMMSHAIYISGSGANILKTLKTKYGATSDHVRAWSALQQVIGQGRVAALLTLVDDYGLTRADISSDKFLTELERILEGGKSAEMVRALALKLNLSKSDIMAVHPFPISRAIAEKDADLLRVYADEVGMNAKDVRDEHAMEKFYDDPDPTVLRVLAKNFRLTADDVRGDDNAILRNAARDGDVEILNVLADDFRLTDVDARARGNEALFVAAENGHSKVLSALANKFHLTVYDARDGRNYPIQAAAKRGHDEVIKVLATDFRLVADDARTKNNRPIYLAAKGGHVAVLRALHDVFGLSAVDARDRNNRALSAAVTGKRIDAIRALHDVFGLTVTDVEEVLRGLLHQIAITGDEIERIVDESTFRVLLTAFHLGPDTFRIENNAILRATTDEKFAVFLRDEAKLTKEDAREALRVSGKLNPGFHARTTAVLMDVFDIGRQ